MFLNLGHDYDSLKKIGLRGIVEIEEEAIQHLGLRLHALRDIHNPAHLEEDMELLAKGILDPVSFRNGYLHFDHTVEVVVREGGEKVKQIARSFNLRTDAGGDFWAGQLCGSAGTATLQWIGLSNDATAPAATDTTLASEITTNGLARASATYAHSSVTGGTNATVTSSLTLSHTWTATGTQSAQKCGVFTASSSGTMGLESAFTQVTVNNGDTAALSYGISG